MATEEDKAKTSTTQSKEEERGPRRSTREQRPNVRVQGPEWRDPSAVQEWHE
jgi:hypothetical protein